MGVMGLYRTATFATCDTASSEVTFLASALAKRKVWRLPRM